MGPAEAVRVNESSSYARWSRNIWNVVEIALRIRNLIVYRRRDDLMSQCETGDNNLRCTACCQRLSTHRLSR